MGVDISVKVRVFDQDQSGFKDIAVTDQDNSLSSLFYNREISYTSIGFDRQQELSPAENELLDMKESEDEEMMVYSRISAAKEVLPVIEKLYKKFYRLKTAALDNDLMEIARLDLSDEERTKKRKYKISEYFDFDTSFGIFYGIIKVAAEQDRQIQLVHLCY